MRHIARSNAPREWPARARSSWPAALVATATACSFGVIFTATASGAVGATSSAASARVGSAPNLPAGAEVVGTLAGTTKLAVDVVMQPRDPAALASFATAVSTPGSPLYHHFLAPGAFPQRFGPTAAAVSAVESDLRSAGLRPGTISADHLIIPVTASASELTKAFSTSLVRVRVGSRVAYVNASAPMFSGAAKSDVIGVVGLDDLYQEHHMSVVPHIDRPHGAASAAGSHATNPDETQCSSAVSIESSEGGYYAQQIEQAYDFSGLYSAGDEGSGVTVGLYELESFDNSDIEAYESCYGISTSFAVTPVDGGPGTTGAGSGEAALDIEDVAGFAPDASIEVYEAPNTNAGALDNYEAMIGSRIDNPDVISTSWGLCESEEGKTAADSEDTLFEEAASDGQSVFAAAGDAGSEDCYDAENASGPTTLAVDDPGSQPYVTSVGGTTMSSLGPPPTESVWNNEFGAGGGGVSTFWKMPSYQADAPTGLKVINGESSGSKCGAASGEYCREVPDVSADADPDYGLIIDYAGEWQPIGGTSMDAPMWAAITALVDADSTSACDGSLGFANPALYDVAGSAYSSSFHDVTSGTNDFTGTNNNLYEAGTGYDMASGLGTPDLGGLAAHLCTASALAPAAPASVTAKAGSVGTPGNGQVAISWPAPADHGSAIERYVVTVSPACSDCTGRSPTGTSTTVAGLTPATRYTFSVAAVNANGTGPTKTSNAIEVYTVPSSPSAVSVKASAAGVDLTFAAPKTQGGLAVSGYLVAPSPACATCGGTSPSSTSTTITGVHSGTSYRFTVRAKNSAGVGPSSAPSAPITVKIGDGYWLAARNGRVFGLGAAPSLGNDALATASDPAVSIAAAPGGSGYFVATADGSVSAFGARYIGDLPSEHIDRTDIVAVVPTVNGGGYWLVGADGEVYTFGDAPFHGDLLSLSHPVHVTDIVGMVASPADTGYMLIASDGGVFAFGSTHFYGSLPGIGVKVNDIRAILPSATGKGYVLVGADGGAFVFGTGTNYYGSLPARHISVDDIVGLAITPDGAGYYMAGSNGAVYGFGDAVVFPEPSSVRANLPIAAVAGV
jgi:hypothetical protein